MNKLLIICGPTATGKTKLAVTIAKTFGGELVNADSRQVYKGLDALTGKDQSEDVPIWLYDIVDGSQEFSVAHFVRLARVAIDDIHKRGKLPIVVGGTGFYLRALTTSIATLAVPPNPELRKTLYNASVDVLQQELRRVDPVRWSALNDSDRKNLRRLIRAIEVARSPKVSSRARPCYDALWIGLTLDREALKQRISKRVAERFDKAMVEVREGLPPILGVEPLLLFLKGAIMKEEALRKWAQAEYRYAKRQLTWFKKQKGIHWFTVAPGVEDEVERLVSTWYTTS